KLTEIFNEAGFANVTVVDATDAQAGVGSRFVRRANGKWTAANFPGGDPKNLTDGTDVSYFDFFIFSEETEPEIKGEGAHAEALNFNFMTKPNSDDPDFNRTI